MAENNSNEDKNLVASCEDEEMMLYKANALDVITFRIVRNENDLETKNKKTNSFNPAMAHQIFGETEMIFGYKNVSINFYYLHNSAKCFVDVLTSEKIVESEGCKADNIEELLNPWLPADYSVNKEDFKKLVQVENPTVIYGEVINSFKDKKEKNFKVTLCDNKNKEFKEFHQRFETFIVWFIDGANFIDLDDQRWLIFYVYEEYQSPAGNTTWYSPVGFCTAYKFYRYPDSTRPRISQFFILPTYQKRGIGTNLYKSVYNYLKDLPDSGEITVEEPTDVFQKIRDFCDSLQIYKTLEEKNINISTQNQKRISAILKEQKICKRQAQRIVDILECLKAYKSGYEEYQRFIKSIRARIENDIKKESRGGKLLCNLQKAGIITEPLDKKASIDVEYNRYIESLEWPINHLKAQLGTS